MKLPKFKYHHDPVWTGNVVQTDFCCICCNKLRNYLYVGPVYTTYDIDNEICIWCIAEGKAAKKFKASFGGDLDKISGINKQSIKELEERTPGYISWQGETWLTHCNEICVFYGDFSKRDLLYTNFDDLKEYVKRELDWSEQDLKEYALIYDPKDSPNPAFYKFVCSVCYKVLIHCDFT